MIPLVPIRRSAYFRGVSLRRSDLEGILSFLVDIGEVEFDEPYPVAVLARLRDLVPCDALTYQEIDLRARRFGTMVHVGPDDDDDDDDDEGLYWSAGPCPISEYRVRTGDLSPMRMSDLVERRRYLESPFYREYFKPGGVDHAIDVGLPTAPWRHRSFVLFRETDAGDFSERDRAVLEQLRPHLNGLEANAAMRRRLGNWRAANDGEGNAVAQSELTPREREIVGLVAEGRTNAQIAAQLWVAPSTVKKHLEHVYEKLGVAGRTAAATRLHASL
jgi:DNA-binding CsgD family transcriptional regulator